MDQINPLLCFKIGPANGREGLAGGDGCAKPVGWSRDELLGRR
jgi:hypothetical protein